MADDRYFDRIFELYREPVQRYCLRRLPVDEVNDAVAETFLVAWRRITETPDDMVLPWLYGIAHNVVLNINRSRRRRTSLTDLIERQPLVDTPDPETLVLRDLESQTVLKALSTLRPEDQELLRLKTWERLSHEEIARALDVSTHAVDMRLNRAKTRLANAYKTADRRSNSTVSSPRLAGGGGQR